MTMLPMIDQQIRERLNNHEHHPQMITGDCAECQAILAGAGRIPETHSGAARPTRKGEVNG